ncbi:hypothetical protein CATRI_00390 [Corynebacterium atrinae]|uniref:Rv0909 family putative TA system antitoxin n=1 Tax=Corynebacterium atrinae TaxID=1336740 RepID=UPI0025B57996|nr:Rv0909 family putative TA system antitoxin [Corynebacterium atrinae]WJY62200.1 hypothetical protein CATRI_00390 [Corynebacterium atrinae]
MSFIDKAKAKANEFLNNEESTDQVLDKVEKFATDTLGEDKAEKIRSAREAVDEKLGDKN